MLIPDWEEGGGEGGQQQQRGRGEQQGGQRGVPGGRAGGGHAGDRGEQVLGRPEVSRSVDTQCREHVTLKNVPDTTSRLKGRARAKPCSSRLRNTNLYLHKQCVKSETMQCYRSQYTLCTIYLRSTWDICTHDSLPVTRRGAWQLVVLQGGLLVLVGVA